MKPSTIAIDGPAGAGKSTVARLLAQRLGYLYIDSGAMYRAVALRAERTGVSPAEPDAVAALARTARITFVLSDNQSEQRTFLEDEDVSADLRAPEIGLLASEVSAIPGVRAALVSQQQALGAGGGVVMEGRDIGTVVFPHADIKVFLTASPEERASRRHKDLVERGADASLEKVRADQDTRDERDATRAVSPLVAAKDALVLESDGLTPEEVVAAIWEMVETRRQER